MPTKPDLSIIIPCYNCSSTLEEAIASCFHQGLGSFEIVLVNDCSTDNTWAVMKDLAQRHPEISIHAHEKNLGGGATRNTATSLARADVVFCLDSDDMLGDGTLSKMLSHLSTRGLDGVGVSTSVKFRGTDLNDVAFTNHFDRVGETILFTDLFEKKPSCSLYSVFMYTKRAFAIAGAYPTHHGFDTQGFAFRFLANGLRAETCPETTYLHRVSFHASYYIREYEGGKVNHNWLKVYEEFLYLFDEETQAQIIGFDFNSSALSLNSVINAKDSVLSTDWKRLVGEDSRKRYAQELVAKGDGRTDLEEFWLGSYELSSGRPDAALPLLSRASQTLALPLVFARLSETLVALGQPVPEDVTAQAKPFYAYVPQGSKAPIALRVWRKIKRTLNIQ
jgi:glycosyltransferase involved in cell wall biosynthesis